MRSSEQMPMGMSLSMRSCGSLLEFLNEELYPLHAGVRYSELLLVIKIVILSFRFLDLYCRV